MEEKVCDSEAAMMEAVPSTLPTVSSDPNAANLENWADFESASVHSSKSLDASPTPTTSLQTPSFEKFDSSWHSWILGGAGSNGSLSFENRMPATTSQEDDVWMSQLLPLQDHNEQQAPRSVPALRRNPRDDSYHLRQYHRYQAAYTQQVIDASSAYQHLSNEEWIAQRRRREGHLQRRFQQEVEQMFVQQHVVRTPSDHRILQRRWPDAAQLRATTDHAA